MSFFSQFGNFATDAIEKQLRSILHLQAPNSCALLSLVFENNCVHLLLQVLDHWQHNAHVEHPRVKSGSAGEAGANLSLPVPHQGRHGDPESSKLLFAQQHTLH